jgi:methionine-rich copper-binding protein CopC
METLRIRIFLLMLVGLLTVGSPALAHSALVSTNPAPNSTVETGPRLIKLGFSTPFLFLNDTYEAELQLQSPSGQVLTPKCSTAEIRTLLSVYDLTQAGRYKVTWRAVSDDGHVIGGSHRFSVSDTDPDTTNNEAVCENFGLQPGQVKKPSSQAFDDNEFALLPWVGLGSLAILLSFLAYRFSKKNLIQGD